MDSLSFDNIKYILFLACTIVGANLLDVCISDNFPNGTAAIHTYYPCEEQYKEANFIAITSDFALITNRLAKGHKTPTSNGKKHECPHLIPVKLLCDEISHYLMQNY